jgi:sugar transferase (PEP-CTERM/EpsH1 system associated)
MSKPILIAHVIYRLDVGGLENGLVNLINNMSTENYNHVIICLTDFTDFIKRFNRKIEIYALNKKEGNDFGLYFRFYKLIKKLKPDIVHTRNLATLEMQFPSFLAGIQYRIHGEHGRGIQDPDGTNKKNIIIRRIFSFFVNRYIPLSKDLESYLIDKVKVSRKRITQIYNGVDTGKFIPEDDKKYNILPDNLLSRDMVIVGTVGRMDYVKDQVTLAKAFVNTIVKEGETVDQVRLIMIGDGALRADVTDVLNKGHAREKSWLAGTRSDIPELMRLMDIFVLPSLAEGISNTILEAMSTGLPVIATDVGGNGELVDDTTTGYLVPKDDPDAMSEAIIRYVKAPELRRAHGTNARSRILEKFSIESMVKAYEAVYQRVH